MSNRSKDDPWREVPDDAKQQMEDLFEDLKESGALRDQPSEEAPDYEDAEFPDSEGQQYVAKKRKEAKALPEPERTLAQRIKRFFSELWQCVLHRPYFSWPEPDLGEVVSDPLEYTGKGPERMMELAGIDPDDDPLSGVAPGLAESSTKYLPKLEDEDFHRNAYEVLREREQTSVREFYREAVSDDSGLSQDAGFHEFLGNALMNESAESSGWVEDKAGITLQDVVDRAVARIEDREDVDPVEFEAFVREAMDISETDYPFDLQQFGDMETLYGVVSEALEGDDPTGFDPQVLSDRAGTAKDVARVFGEVYHEAIQTTDND